MEYTTAILRDHITEKRMFFMQVWLDDMYDILGRTTAKLGEHWMSANSSEGT